MDRNPGIADGLRRSWSDNATTKQYVWDNQNMLLEIWSNGVLSGEYTVTPDLYGEHLSEGSGGFYSADGVGSVWEVTDAGENEVGELGYDPYGDRPSASGDIPRLRYTGKLGAFRITESGVRLEDMRGRWYSWDLGRFVSRDPIMTPGSPYMYALNNPLNWVDPSGLEGCSPTPPTVDPSTQFGWTLSPGPGQQSLAQMHVSFCDLVRSGLKQAERDLWTAWPLGKNAPGDPQTQACMEMKYWAQQAAMATCYFPWKAPWGDPQWNQYHPCCCGCGCGHTCPLDKGGSGGSSGGGSCPNCGGASPMPYFGPLFPPGIMLPYLQNNGFITAGIAGSGLGPTSMSLASDAGGESCWELCLIAAQLGGVVGYFSCVYGCQHPSTPPPRALRPPSDQQVQAVVQEINTYCQLCPADAQDTQYATACCQTLSALAGLLFLTPDPSVNFMDCIDTCTGQKHPPGGLPPGLGRYYQYSQNRDLLGLAGAMVKCRGGAAAQSWGDEALQRWLKEALKDVISS